QRRMEEIEQELQIASAETADLRGRLILQDLQRSLGQSLATVNNKERVEKVRLAHRVDQQTQLDAIFAAAELARDKAQQDLDVAMQRAHAETCVYELKEHATALPSAHCAGLG